MAYSTPTVSGSCLYRGGRFDFTRICEVGSGEWFAWLDSPNVTTFYFNGLDVFTARKEKRRNSFYWYAYLKRNERTTKVYLGASRKLTLEYMQGKAYELCMKA